MWFSLSIVISLGLAVVQGHYNYPVVVYNGTTSGLYEYARLPDNPQWHDPVTDINDPEMTCLNVQTNSVSDTLPVLAGDRLTALVYSHRDYPSPPISPYEIYHPSVTNVYLAKVPDGVDIKDFQGKGEVWFRIHEDTAHVYGEPAPGNISFDALYSPSVNFTIPKNTPDGEYLVRIENMALHVTYYKPAPFFINCLQIQVIGGGTGTPGPLVAFPGFYKGDEPGLNIDIWGVNRPPPSNYTQPGPPLWRG